MGLAFAAVSLLSGAAKADEAALFACIERFKKVGLSADLAYSECKKKSLGECIKEMAGTNYVARSIERRAGGYLIDLGNDDSRWLEGGPWKDLGCKPYDEGPKRRQQSMTTWGFDSVNTWFRQGICSRDSVQLNQPYSIDEAKALCELREAGIKRD